MIATRMARFGAGVTVLASALVVLGQAVMAAAAPAPPHLSITLSDGRSAVRPHAADEYRITLVNDGADAAKGVLIFTAPPNAEYQQVSGGGRITSDAIRWKITVGAGASRTEHVTVRLRAIPQSAVRVTTLASFYLGAVTSTPLIRTADADRIPGRADPAPVPSLPPLATVQDAPATSSSGLSAGEWALIAAGAALLVGAGLAVVWRGRIRVRGKGVTPTRPSSNAGDRESQADGFALVGFGGDADE